MARIIASPGSNAPGSNAHRADRLHTLLRVGSIMMALPQRQVRSLELAVDVERGAEPPERGVGWIEFARRRWPVYALGPELELAPDRALDRGACVLIERDGGLFGIVVDEVERCDIDVETPLPPSMRGASTPIEALATLESGVVCLSSARALAAWVGA